MRASVRAMAAEAAVIPTISNHGVKLPCSSGPNTLRSSGSRKFGFGEQIGGMVLSRKQMPDN